MSAEPYPLTPDLKVLLVHAPKTIPENQWLRIEIASQLKLALPLELFIELQIVRRSTTFRDRNLGLIELQVVGGHSSVTPQDLAAYLLLLQAKGAAKKQRPGAIHVAA
jgi:hypothetical protein